MEIAVMHSGFAFVCLAGAFPRSQCTQIMVTECVCVCVDALANFRITLHRGHTHFTVVNSSDFCSVCIWSVVYLGGEC